MRTHLLAISICPPWKPMPASLCVDAARTLSETFRNRLDIAPGDITTLVNEAATTDGVRTTFAHLGPFGATDRLIVYINLHSGALDLKRARPDDDVFILWTEKKPTVMAFAVAEGEWISAHEFAGLVQAAGAGEVIVIVDSCESDAVSPLFIHAHPANDPARPKAVVVSARADEFANVGPDNRMALYSEEMLRAVAAGQTTFEAALDVAAAATTVAAVGVCDSEKQELMALGLPARACLQHPETHDPDGLLRLIHLRN